MHFVSVEFVGGPYDGDTCTIADVVPVTVRRYMELRRRKGRKAARAHQYQVTEQRESGVFVYTYTPLAEAMRVVAEERNNGK